MILPKVRQTPGISRRFTNIYGQVVSSTLSACV